MIKFISRIVVILSIFCNYNALAASNSVIGGAFELMTHDGQKFTEQDLKGKWSLIYFGFTFCPDICPMALNNLSLLENEVDKKTMDKINIVFVTVDPERDDIPLMKEYMSNFSDRIIGLTGSREKIDEALKAYKVYSVVIPNEESPHNYSMNHTSLVYVMDPELNFVTVFSHETSVEDIVKIVKKYVK